MNKIENLNLAAMLIQGPSNSNNNKQDTVFKDVFSRTSEKTSERIPQSNKREIDASRRDFERNQSEKTASKENQNSKISRDDQKETIKEVEKPTSDTKEASQTEKPENKENQKTASKKENPESVDEKNTKEKQIDENLIASITSLLKTLSSHIENNDNINHEKMSQVVKEIEIALGVENDFLEQLGKGDIKPEDFLKILSEAGVDVNKLIQEYQALDKNINFKPEIESTSKNSKNRNESKTENAELRKDMSLGVDLKAQLMTLKSEGISQEKMMFEDDFSESMMKYGFLNNDSDEAVTINDIKLSSFGFRGNDSLGDTGIKDSRPMQVINKIVQEIKSIIGKDKSEINIKLQPESLGKVSIKISSENGVLNASFYAENDRAKAMLESNMEALRKNLEDQGIQISELNVFVGSNPDDLNRHKNIMEAQKYNKLKTETNLGVENVLDDISAPLNPYIIEDMFSDLI